MDQTVSPDARPPAPPVPVADSRRTRLRRRWKRVPLPLRIVSYVLLALFILWLVLFITKGRFLKGPFQSIASRSLQREVKIGGDFQLYFAPINIQFLAGDIRIANPAWVGRQPFFYAKLIDTRVSLVSLVFQDKKRARWLNLRNASVDLQWSPDGRRNNWTFGDPDAKGEPMELPVITRADITGTNIRYRDPRLQITANIDIDTVRAADTRFSSDIRFHGSGTMRGNGFSLRGGLLSPTKL